MMEREPKDHRLFHYTKQLEFLEGILNHGFWPRYCEEEFNWLFGQPVVMAFPMVCFSDMPLDTAFTHRDRYGDYAIGFSKDIASRLDINPVWYIDEKSSIAKKLQSGLKPGTRFSLEALDQNLLRSILPFLKPTWAFQRYRNAAHSNTIEGFAAEEELEWRHSPQTLSESWFQNTCRGFVTESDHHSISKSHRVKLKIEMVDEVIVPTESEADKLRTSFPGIADRIRTW